MARTMKKMGQPPVRRDQGSRALAVLQRLAKHQRDRKRFLLRARTIDAAHPGKA